MADISTYLANIMSAVYGEEVRGSIHDAIAAMNSDLEAAIRDDLNPLAFKGNLGESGGTNNNLNNLVQTDQRGIWRLLGGTTYTNVPSDFVNSKQAYLIMYAFGTSGQVATVIKQEIHYFSDSGANANVSWSRVYISSEWQPWHKNVDNTLSIEGAAADAKAVNDKLIYYINKFPKMATIEDLPDLNLVDSNTIMTFVAADNSLPENMPNDYIKGEYYTIISVMSGSIMSGGSIQLLFNSANQVWVRYKKNSSTWFDWHNYMTYCLNNYPSMVNEEVLSDANNISTTITYTFVVTNEYMPANLPKDIKNGEYYTLTTILSGSIASGGSIQILLNDLGEVWVRYKQNASIWYNWNKITGYYSDYTVINYTNYSSLLPDVNDIDRSSTYCLIPSLNGSPLHLPLDIEFNDYYILRTTRIAVNAAGGGTTQELISSDNGMWVRTKLDGNTWGSWTRFNTSGYENMTKSSMINATNYGTLLPDLNSVPSAYSTIYTFVTDPSGMPSNCPIDVPKNEYAIVRTTIANNGSGGTFQELLVGSCYFHRWKYTSSGKWGNWASHIPNGKYTVKKDGTGDFTSVYEAVRYARETPNSIVYVEEGSYDLIQEFENYFGSDWFDNYNPQEATDWDWQGMGLTNGITLIFSSNAKLLCNYTGTNGLVRRSFSAINMRWGDAHLINVTIEGSNIRYIVHDDPITNKSTPWRHTYKNCNFKLDNTSALSSFASYGCIGGGTGSQSEVIIEDCIFESVSRNPRDTIVSFHNNEAANSKSRLVIKNCWFKTGTCTVQFHGSSTEKSEAIIVGNHLNAQPYMYQENSEYDIQNWEMYAWNNDVETNAS